MPPPRLIKGKPELRADSQIASGDDLTATSTAAVLSTASRILRTATILRRPLRIRAPIKTANGDGTTQKGWAMTERKDRLAREREEIAARVANFKATQEKFAREREEFFVATLENARNGSDGAALWS
jgi:chorismate mutase